MYGPIFVMCEILHALTVGVPLDIYDVLFWPLQTLEFSM